MKYYEEAKMASVRKRLEAEVAGWPAVTRKQMFGCPCYQAGGRLFAFLVTGGLVLTKLSPDERAAALGRFAGVPFRAGPKMVPGWPQLPLEKPAGLRRYAALLRQSYESARAAGRAGLASARARR